MELALYCPGLGYYSAGVQKLGPGGDFVTAPEISPLFARTLARQVGEILGQIRGDVLELGAGSGRLACDLLLALEQLEQLPRAYLILEVSADLAARQRGLIESQVPHLAPRVSWIKTLPHSFTGIVLANEVLDALPVHVVAWRSEGLFERGVAGEGGRFAWSERPLADGPLLEAAQRLHLPSGYVSEISLAAPALVETLGRVLLRGALLFIDYGFPEAEYYHPQRFMGTLMCHYRHHVHDDPFFLPGLCDITAHVNFSTVAQALAGAGLDLLGYASQAQFLVNCGITELLAKTSPDDLPAYLPLASGAQKLLSPAEMGELFKVLAAGKGLPCPLLGFRDRDRQSASRLCCALGK